MSVSELQERVEFISDGSVFAVLYVVWPKFSLTPFFEQVLRDAEDEGSAGLVENGIVVICGEWLRQEVNI